MPIRSLRSMIAGRPPIVAASITTVVEAARTMKQSQHRRAARRRPYAAHRHLHRARRAVQAARRGPRSACDATRRRDDRATADNPSRRAVRARAADDARGQVPPPARSSSSIGRSASCPFATRWTRIFTSCASISSNGKRWASSRETIGGRDCRLVMSRSIRAGADREDLRNALVLIAAAAVVARMRGRRATAADPATVGPNPELAAAASSR